VIYSLAGEGMGGVRVIALGCISFNSPVAS
jgi:hypothetical protein